MKILLAHSFYRIPGGEDRYVRQQAELLARAHSIEIFSGRNEQLGENVATAARMFYSSRTKLRVSRVLNRFNPDIVHVHNVYPFLGSAVHHASSESGIPLVMTVHNYRMRCPNGLMFTEGSACRRCQLGNYVAAMTHDCFPSRKQSVAYASALWLHRFASRLEDKVSLFVCPSNFVREEVVRWGLPPSKVVLVPNFVYPRVGAEALPGRFGVFVGRLSSEKGVHVLLDALRIAKDPPFKVVGGGPLAARLQSEAATIGLKNTEFLGELPVDRVDEVLREARFVVLPSLWDETGGLAALEAMARGRPLLVTSRGGLPELVQEGTGLICAPGNPAEMAKSIERLMEDDAFCLEAGTRGLSVSRRKFGPEVHLASLEAAYGTCIK